MEGGRKRKVERKERRVKGGAGRVGVGGRRRGNDRKEGK